MNRTIDFTRIHLIFLGVFVVTAAIILRLFYLQVVAHAYYEEIANAEQHGQTRLPARRGEILIEDYHSGESYKLATNTTLNMIYADPTLINEITDNHNYVARTLAPLLFDIEIEREIDEQKFEEEYENILQIEDEELRKEALDDLDYKDDDELFEAFEENLAATLAQRTRDVILIDEALDDETQKEIRELNLEGVEVTENGNLYAYPGNIADKSRVAKALSKVFDTDQEQLERILLGKNRFVILKRKLEPEISNQIEDILEKDYALKLYEGQEEPRFLGIRMEEEFFRFYPEESLAAQVLGYVNSAGDGQYGIEGTFNEVLKGQDGVFTSQIDAYGNQITVGKSVIENAVNGADITLTIDRAIQLQAERYIEQGVKEYNADSGEVIVADPQTGAILAMAQWPTYNPNLYGEVFEKERIDLTEEEIENIYITGTEEEPRYWHYIQVDPDVRIELFPDPEKEDVYYTYANQVGPEVYKNKSLQEVYEPGSIFKPLAMVSALDAGELTPNTTFVDDGPLEVDYNVYTERYDNKIDNFDGAHHGVQTMTQVLEKSNNIGMAYVARQLGPALFYSYIKAFGLTQRTDIGINDEVMGRVSHYDTWLAESEQLTKAFGQGISMTPIQLIQAYTALANKGTMMRPYLIKQIEYEDGRTESFEPEVVRKPISEEAADMITAMMTATGESYGPSLALEDHFTAMKSGTAQTYKWGRALSGPGTTIGSFVGYGPIEDPQFLMLVKIDHPRTIEWGARTAGPVWRNIAEFLYDYYNLSPDK